MVKRTYRRSRRNPVYRRKKVYRAFRVRKRFKGTRMKLYRRPKLALGSFPNTKTVNLRYVQDFSLNPGDGSTSVQVFRANSVFDPDFSGTGHQPMFRDNYAALYDTYQVNHAHITFIAAGTHIVNNSVVLATVEGFTTQTSQYYAANERAVRMFIIRDKSATDYTTALNTLIEEGNTNVVWRYCPQTTSAKMPILRMKCWPAALHKISKLDDTLKSAQGSNPATPTYFICGVDSLPGSNSDSMPFQAIITYNVTFSDIIKNQSQN